MSCKDLGQNTLKCLFRLVQINPHLMKSFSFRALQHHFSSYHRLHHSQFLYFVALIKGNYFFSFHCHYLDFQLYLLTYYGALKEIHLNLITLSFHFYFTCFQIQYMIIYMKTSMTFGILLHHIFLFRAKILFFIQKFFPLLN